MEYEYQLMDHGDYAVVKLPKKVMIPYSSQFKVTLQSAYDQGHSTIILDCEHLQMFDTAGISAVAVFQKKLKERGGELKIINVANDYIKHLFRTIELNKLVSIEEV